MNATLATRTHFNQFSKSNYYDLLVDGHPLESLALELNPGLFQPGLVPTLLNWLRDENERNAVWTRIKPDVDSVSVCPVLMCSEDIDLHCTLMVVEIKSYPDSVVWTKMAAGHSMADYPDYDFTDLSWVPNWNALEFTTENYDNVLEKFRRYLDDDSLTVYPPNASERVTIRDY